MQQGRVSQLRAAFREDAGLARPFGCLEACIQLLRAGGEGACTSVVETLQRHLGVAEVVWLAYRQGVLEGVAAAGSAAGAGTRHAIRPALQPLLTWPCRSVLRHPPQTCWLAQAPDPGFEWLLPLVRDGQVTGLLGIAGQPGQEPPAPADQRLMEVVSVVLARAPSGVATAVQPAPARARDLARLTPRERQVLSLLPRGFSNARIADSLGVATGTVKTHVERILGKLQLDDRAQAAARAIELGLGHSGLDG